MLCLKSSRKSTFFTWLISNQVCLKYSAFTVVCVLSSFFHLEENRSQGERAMSSPQAMLLSSRGQDHPLWRHQVSGAPCWCSHSCGSAVLLCSNKTPSALPFWEWKAYLNVRHWPFWTYVQSSWCMRFVFSDLSCEPRTLAIIQLFYPKAVCCNL